MTHGHQGAFESLEGMGSKIGSGSIAASRFEIGSPGATRTTAGRRT